MNRFHSRTCLVASYKLHFWGLLFYCWILHPLQAQEHHMFSNDRWQTGYTTLPLLLQGDTTRLMQMISKGKAFEHDYPDSAMMVYQLALKESKKIGLTDGVAIALFNIGRIQIHAGLLDSALATFSTALPHCLKVRYFRHLAPAVYSNIGAIYLYKGNYKPAIQYYDSAIREGIRAGLSEDRVHLVNTYINISSVHTKLRQYHHALFYIDKAEEISRRKNYQEQLAMVMLNKGTIYRYLGQYSEAQKYYLKSITIAEEYHYAITQQNACSSLAEMLLQQGKFEEAAVYWEKIKQAEDIPNAIYRYAMLNLSLGNNFLISGNHKAAERHLLMALHYTRQLGMEEDKMRTLAALAEVYEQTDRYAQALAYQKAYTQLKDSLLNIAKLKDINELDIKYRSAEKDKKIALQAVAVRVRDIWIGAGGTGLIVLVFLFLILYRHYRQRRKLGRQEQEITQLKAMMKGEEKERSRIARELHDGIGSMLAAIKMGLSELKDQRATGRPYGALVGMVEETADEVRRTAHNLIPTVLERSTLEEALNHYCASLSLKEGLNVEAHFNGPVQELDQAAALIIYRIVQELLQNVVKHAAATFAEVQIIIKPGKLNIIVEDNGKGFDETANYGGMGMSNLRYRVNALHGYLSIDSVPGKSTTAFIELDLEKLKLMV